MALGRVQREWVYPPLEKFSICEVPGWQMMQYLTQHICNDSFFAKLNQTDTEINTCAEIALQIFVFSVRAAFLRICDIN